MPSKLKWVTIPLHISTVLYVVVLAVFPTMTPSLRSHILSGAKQKILALLCGDTEGIIYTNSVFSSVMSNIPTGAKQEI